MENLVIIEKLNKAFSRDILEVDVASDILSFTVTSLVIHEVILFLKENENLQFSFLTDLCGIHYPDQELPLGVVYHLHNLIQRKRIRIRTFLSIENPKLSSISDIFSSANWMERETYDFYGIIFEGHPNLKRILNMDDLDFFPMRKEYPLEDPTREDKDDRYFGR